MLPRTIVSFGRVERRTEAPQTNDALIVTFLSSFQGAAPGVVAGYRAAARHFLYWIGQQGVAVSAVDDAVVQRFEKHRCRCRPFPLHEPNRPSFTGRVRRFVRFLEDRGAVDVTDDVDNLASDLADYAVFLERLRIPAKPPAYSRVNSPTDSDIISPMDSRVIPPGCAGPC